MHAIPAPVSGWEKPGFEQKVAEVMIKRAEKIIPGLSQKILYQEFWSPVAMNKYLMCGVDASMGWRSLLSRWGQNAWHKKHQLKNLFFKRPLDSAGSRRHVHRSVRTAVGKNSS